MANMKFPRKMIHFTNHVRLAVAITVLQIQFQRQKQGEFISISELCAILKEKRVNWKSRFFIDFKRNVQCLQTQIATSKDSGYLEQSIESTDELILQSFEDNKLAESFSILTTLPFNEEVTIHRETIAQCFIIGMKFLDEAIDKSYCSDELLKTCGQILRKAYPFTVDVDDFFTQFVTSKLQTISKFQHLNQYLRLSRLEIVLSSVMTDSNLQLLETTFQHLFQQIDDKLKFFFKNYNSSEFEIIFYLFETAELIIKQVPINSKTNKIYCFFIKLLDILNRIYELSLNWPIITFRIWQLIELIQKFECTGNLE